MKASELPRAVAAAMSTAAALDLAVDDAVVLQDANRLALRLMPCDVVARVAPMEYQASAEYEVELALRLATTDSPVAALEPRIEPRVYVRDGFVMNMWTYYESVSPRDVPPGDCADALRRLHAGMRLIELTTPHFMDRVAEAQRLVGSHEHSPALADADRELLTNTLRDVGRTISDRAAAEQVLHGEPHPWNVLGTTKDLRFIDLETCCRGPVEFDLAHVPEEVKHAIRTPIKNYSGCAVASFLRWLQRGAGVETTITPTVDDTRENSSAPWARVSRGQRSTLSTAE